MFGKIPTPRISVRCNGVGSAVGIVQDKLTLSHEGQLVYAKLISKLDKKEPNEFNLYQEMENLIGQRKLEEVRKHAIKTLDTHLHSDKSNIIGTALILDVVTAEYLKNGNYTKNSILAKLAAGEGVTRNDVLTNFAASSGMSESAINNILADGRRNTKVIMDPDVVLPAFDLVKHIVKIPPCFRRTSCL